MKNNIYSIAVQSIEDSKAEKTIFINSEDIKEVIKASIRMDEFDKEELFEFYLNSIVTTALNMWHCYSKRRGAGIYVNVDACMNIDVLNQLIANVKDDISADSSRYSVINRRINQLNLEQYFMNLDDVATPIQTIGDAISLTM